jgi:hypothetical protein
MLSKVHTPESCTSYAQLPDSETPLALEKLDANFLLQYRICHQLKRNVLHISRQSLAHHFCSNFSGSVTSYISKNNMLPYRHQYTHMLMHIITVVRPNSAAMPLGLYFTLQDVTCVLVKLCRKHYKIYLSIVAFYFISIS